MNKTMVQECLVGLSSFIALFFLCLSSLPLPLRSLRCVNGREHDVSRGDRGGDGSYPTPAGSPGAQRVRAALHVSVCVFSETRGSPFFEFFFFLTETQLILLIQHKGMRVTSFTHTLSLVLNI